MNFHIIHYLLYMLIMLVSHDSIGRRDSGHVHDAGRMPDSGRKTQLRSYARSKGAIPAYA
jgi:hypothetical protein